MDEVTGPDSVLRQRPTQNDPHVSDGYGENEPASPGFPPARWALNRKGFPQAVAHRGYKAEYPENTMGAFRGAVKAGATAIETDVHLSKDKVVVIAHDKDLKRCWGEDKLVRECDWAHLSTLKTLREPRQPMPRFLDVLNFLAEPGNEDVWLLLDIKIDDAAEDMMPRIAETIAAASSTAPGTDWRGRILLGCWTARHVKLCHELLPDFAVAWIGITIPLAREYLKVPNIAMNVRQELLFCNPRFVKQCQAEGRPLFAWTVNKVSWMRWAIRAKLDCVVTDDPRLFLEVCEQYRRDAEAGKLGKSSLVANTQDTLYRLLFPVLVKLLVSLLKYYKRVGGPEETRNELLPLTKA